MQRDLAIEMTGSPLESVMANEAWDEICNRLNCVPDYVDFCIDCRHESSFEGCSYGPIKTTGCVRAIVVVR